MSLAQSALDLLSNRTLCWIRRYLPWLAYWINRLATQFLASTTTPRPNAFSLWSDHREQPLQNLMPPRPAADYLSWESVSNKQFFDLHLPPASAEWVKALPSNAPSERYPYGEITQLFAREGPFQPDRSNVFFMFFAQWFTDGFFRSHPSDPNRTTSNHNIDLCQIYGASETACNALRSGEGGKLKCQWVDGEAYPDRLGELNSQGLWQVKAEYQALPYIDNVAVFNAIYGALPDASKAELLATGLERGNAILGHNVISTLFLREHNSLCDMLQQHHPGWDDARLFHTARIINSVILMKLVIEEYVNHIAGLDVLRCDPSFVERQRWYRAPWIAAEFNLLYRWHGLIPDQLDYQGRGEALRHNYGLLLREGLTNLLDAANQQAAGSISLGGVPAFMLPAEQQMIDKGRAWRLNSYNAYREQFGLQRLRSFEQLNANPALTERLRQLYPHIDQLELTVGLFAERTQGRTLTGQLQTAMVAYDALTQIYTNPLFARHNFTATHFTAEGLERIHATRRFQDLANRHLSRSIALGVAYQDAS